MYDNNPMSSLVLFVALREMAANNPHRRHIEEAGLVRTIFSALRRWFAAPRQADVDTTEPAPAKTPRPRPTTRVTPSIPPAFKLPDRPATPRKQTVSAQK